MWLGGVASVIVTIIVYNYIVPPFSYNLNQLDIPLSEAFYMWMLGREKSFTAQDLQHVDPIVARSYAQLATVAVRKHQLESDPLLVGLHLHSVCVCVCGIPDAEVRTGV